MENLILKRDGQSISWQKATPEERVKYMERAGRLIERQRSPKTKNETMVAIGKALREKRKQKKLTLRELYEMCGIGYSALIKIEMAHSNPTISTLDKIAKSLGCRLEVNFVRLKKDGEE